MTNINKKYKKYFRPLIVNTLGLATLICLSSFNSVIALAPPSNPGPGSSSLGLEGTISTAPPTQAATIVSPANGSSYTTLPITVTGLCPNGLLIKIFSNNTFVGSVLCSGGSYSLQISLFAGQNDLVARDYDALDQVGPDSNVVSVLFNDAQTAQFGSQVTLTSLFARRGANPGQELDWPLILSGGSGPYAVSLDWGDGSPTDLLSLVNPGNFIVKHIYKSAGVYRIIIKATDKNGSVAFLQVVGVANGAIQSSGSSSKNGNPTSPPKTKILIWPAIASIPLIIAAFWIGRRHELYTLRRQLEKDRKQSLNRGI